MNSTIKEKWVAALRSGEYSQGKSWLRSPPRVSTSPNPHTFCCLGVLCDIYQKETGKGEWRPPTNGHHYHFEDGVGDESRTSTPAQVVIWSNIDTRMLPVLTFLNDHGSTFEEIAERIESDAILNTLPK